MRKNEKVYSTEKGVISLSSPTKSKILNLLKEGDKTGVEIREEIDRSKSTISVHLSDLIDNNLITEKKHPTDERKKIYSFSSKLVGKSKKPKDKHYKQILDNLTESSNDKYDFLKNLFHVIRYGLSSFGLDIHPALKEMGRDVGHSLAQNFESTNLEDLLVEIQDFWDKNGLGDVDIEEGKYIVVYECFDCSEMPKVDRTLCSLDEGILEGIISEKLGISVCVEEIECFGLGEDHCKFNIKKT